MHNTVHNINNGMSFSPLPEYITTQTQKKPPKITKLTITKLCNNFCTALYIQEKFTHMHNEKRINIQYHC